MAIDVVSMTSEEVAQSLCSAQLEQVYQQSLSKAERIYEEERARSLRVQIFLLEDENDELRQQMEEDEDSMQKIETDNEELRDQLADIAAQYQTVQSELKLQLRDLDRYRTEVNALNAARTDSNSLLSEKLALTRELTTLRPELDHLKTAQTAQQSLLRDKLAIERELSAIQVELETEKRAVQRLKTKDKTIASGDTLLSDEIEDLKKDLAKERRVAKEAAFKDAARVEHIEELERDLARAKRSNVKSSSADAELTEELENLKKELEKERRKASSSKSTDAALSTEIGDLKKELIKARKDTQKTERENLKKGAEWDSQKEVLEEKLDAFRNKLRTTKEQLKEAQDEIEKAEQAKFAAVTQASKARLNTANSRKRNVARFDPDMTIGTPGNGGQLKKQRMSFNPGDKSAFSITPFLNKTTSILPESPEDQLEQDIADKVLNQQIKVAISEADKDIAATISKAVTKTTKGAKKLVTSKMKTLQPLQETTNPKANTIAKKTVLSKVSEEESDAGQGQQKDRDDHEEIEEISKKTVKKRPTIFDDDDEDSAPKKSKKLNLGGLKTGGLGLRKINLGSKNKVLAEFSPLKKDRKAEVIL